MTIDIALNFFSVPSPPLTHGLKVNVKHLEVCTFNLRANFETNEFDQHYQVTLNYANAIAIVFPFPCIMSNQF